MPITLESYRRDPDLRTRLEQAARRERSRQLARLVRALFTGLHSKRRAAPVGKTAAA
jgi:hypothetical protein